MALKKVVIIPVVLFSFLFLWPHLLMFVVSRNRKVIIADFVVAISKRRIRFSGLFMLLYILLVDPFYRKWFYHRIGTISRIVSWYFPGERTFVPCCRDVGPGVYLAHPFSTFVNAKTIGSGFVCRQNTTIGNKYGGDDDKPSIGHNVNLGANVCIIGNISIGNNVTIGAGSVVVKNVPDNVVVAGNPARIIG